MKYLAMLAMALPFIVIFLFISIFSNVYIAIIVLSVTFILFICLLAFAWGANYIFDDIR